MKITFDVVILLRVNDTGVEPEEATVFNTPEQKKLTIIKQTKNI